MRYVSVTHEYNVNCVRSLGLAQSPVCVWMCACEGVLGRESSPGERRVSGLRSPVWARGRASPRPKDEGAPVLTALRSIHNNIRYTMYVCNIYITYLYIYYLYSVYIYSVLYSYNMRFAERYGSYMNHEDIDNIWHIWQCILGYRQRYEIIYDRIHAARSARP